MGCAEDLAIAASVRAARSEAGITQRQLASLIGVASQQMYKYEVGVNRISAGLLVRIARALGRPAASFYNEEVLISKHQTAAIEIVALLRGMSPEHLRTLVIVARALAREGNS